MTAWRDGPWRAGDPAVHVVEVRGGWLTIDYMDGAPFRLCDLCERGTCLRRVANADDAEANFPVVVHEAPRSSPS